MAIDDLLAPPLADRAVRILAGWDGGGPDLRAALGLEVAMARDLLRQMLKTEAALAPMIAVRAAEVHAALAPAMDALADEARSAEAAGNDAAARALAIRRDAFSLVAHLAGMKAGAEEGEPTEDYLAAVDQIFAAASTAQLPV